MVIDEEQRERAPKGSISARLLLRLPSDLDRDARRAAKHEQVSLVEWWRRAGEERLKRKR